MISGICIFVPYGSWQKMSSVTYMMKLAAIFVLFITFVGYFKFYTYLFMHIHINRVNNIPVILHLLSAFVFFFAFISVTLKVFVSETKFYTCICIYELCLSTPYLPKIFCSWHPCLLSLAYLCKKLLKYHRNFKVYMCIYVLCICTSVMCSTS